MVASDLQKQIGILISRIYELCNSVLPDTNCQDFTKRAHHSSVEPFWRTVMSGSPEYFPESSNKYRDDFRPVADTICMIEEEYKVPLNLTYLNKKYCEIAKRMPQQYPNDVVEQIKGTNYVFATHVAFLVINILFRKAYHDPTGLDKDFKKGFSEINPFELDVDVLIDHANHKWMRKYIGSATEKEYKQWSF